MKVRCIRSERKVLVRIVICLKKTLDQKRSKYNILRMKYRTSVTAVTRTRLENHSQLKAKVKALDKNMKQLKITFEI